MGFFARLDHNYLRPFLIYKYHKQLKQPQYEMEDMLNEYNMIQMELLSDDEKDDEDREVQNQTVKGFKSQMAQN